MSQPCHETTDVVIHRRFNKLVYKRRQRMALRSQETTATNTQAGSTGPMDVDCNRHVSPILRYLFFVRVTTCASPVRLRSLAQLRVTLRKL